MNNRELIGNSSDPDIFDKIQIGDLIDFTYVDVESMLVNTQAKADFKEQPLWVITEINPMSIGYRRIDGKKTKRDLYSWTTDKDKFQSKKIDIFRNVELPEPPSRSRFQLIDT